MSRHLPAAAAVALALSLTATPASAAPTRVEIRTISYAPSTVDLPAVGGTVRWSNVTHPSRAHDVVSSLEGYFRSELLTTGETFDVRFTAAGTFTYICSIHDVMLGSVAVPITAEVVTDAQGTRFHLRLGTGALPPTSIYRYVLLRQDPGQTSMRVVRVSRGAVVDIVPLVTGEYRFAARLKDIVAHKRSTDSPTVSLTLAPPPP